MSQDSSSSNSKFKLESERMRPWADALALWRLCDHARCRREHACRCDPHGCFRAVALLPEGVRAWFAGVARAQKEGQSFDEAMAFLDGTDAGDALRDWHHAVAASLGRDEALPHHWWGAAK
jgi:hypothetical protein